MIGQWDETDCVLAFAPNAWSKGNGTANQNTGNFPTYPSGAYQNCPLTNMGTGYGYVYNSGDGYLRYDGVNDYVDTQYKMPVITDVTYELIIDYEISAFSRMMFGILDDNYHYLFGRIQNTGKVALYSRASSVHAADLTETAATITAGRHMLHIRITPAGTATIAFDGVLQSAYDSQDSMDVPGFTDAMPVGARSDGGGTPLSSNLHWFAVYHTLLSESRMTKNASLGADMGLVGTNSGDSMALAAPATLKRFRFGSGFGF